MYNCIESSNSVGGAVVKSFLDVGFSNSFRKQELTCGVLIPVEFNCCMTPSCGNVLHLLQEKRTELWIIWQFGICMLLKCTFIKTQFRSLYIFADPVDFVVGLSRHCLQRLGNWSLVCLYRTDYDHSFSPHTHMDQETTPLLQIRLRCLATHCRVAQGGGIKTLGISSNYSMFVSLHRCMVCVRKHI